ncbi:uncharacterized protein LOC100265247 isoform X1 [Vitis vinifera]|uniref:uncharacterized protein LOC100265247 isoform X1 n=1 Tax=Vitis vinifera TaxID=29760 RepID=UPI00053F6BF7|nr:uncharacterized protein LOC100265247 isoform X1 [Vitis vinifera]|eukprot:XP_010647936.1 PREDICTED: uncharacterized protein LOC100265247 isoform X1 [Vitis vinifera]
MARTGVAKTQVLFLSSCRGAKPVWRGLSKVAGAEGAPGKARGRTDGADHKGDGSSSSWVPHPRTGIYFPEGHDHMMDDVPDGAACFGQTYWLRTVDGVDKPDPDV